MHNHSKEKASFFAQFLIIFIIVITYNIYYNTNHNVIVMLIIRDRSTMRVSAFATCEKLHPYSPGKVNHARTDNDYLWCHIAQFLVSPSLILEFSREQSTLIIKINVIF